MNGKYYIGVHKTETPNDDYLGSGPALKKAIEKYGMENFKKEILYIFQTAEEAYCEEERLVIVSEETYNLKKGGLGGFDYINSLGLENSMKNPETAKKVGISVKKTWEKNREKFLNISLTNIKKARNARKGQKDTKETKEKRKKSLKKYYERNDSPLKGKPLPETQKEKMSKAWTEERKKKQSERMKEEIKKNPNIILGRKGKTASPETKKRLSAVRKAFWDEKKKDKGTCPYCKKEGVLISMKRWHFEKCKLKGVEI
jgi:hypothetical protein